MSPLPACSRRTAEWSPHGLREAGRAAEHLRPVQGEALDVLRVLARVGERVVQLGVGEAARVVGGGEREERGLATGELVESGPHPASLAHGFRGRHPHCPLWTLGTVWTTCAAMRPAASRQPRSRAKSSIRR